VTALRYVSLNPVRARMVARAQDWRWSSTRAHLGGRDDGLTARAPVRELVPDFAGLIAVVPDPDMMARLRAAESIGRRSEIMPAFRGLRSSERVHGAPGRSLMTRC
jgi:putative transposase